LSAKEVFLDTERNLIWANQDDDEDGMGDAVIRQKVKEMIKKLNLLP
jgi:hypothetical protein